MDIVLNEAHSATFWAYDSLNQPLVGEAGNFQAVFSVNGSPAVKTIIITEVDDVDPDYQGQYRYTFTPDEKRDWYLHITLPGKDELGWEGNFRVVDHLAEDIPNLGSGDRVVEITVQDDSTLAPIVDAAVTVYDATETVIKAVGRTDGDGKVTFNLYDGSYKVYLSKVGQYSFTIPEDLVVSSSPPPPDVSVVYEGTAFSPTPPPSADVCVVYGWELTPDGVGVAVEIESEIMASNYFMQTNPHVIRKVTTTSDPNHVNGPGYWELAITKTSEFAGADEVTYRFSIDEQEQGDYIIPDQASIAFKDLIGL